MGGSTSPARGSTEAPVTTIAAGTCTITAYDSSNSGGQATLSSRSRPGRRSRSGRCPASRSARRSPCRRTRRRAAGVVQLGHAVGVHGGGFRRHDRSRRARARSPPRRAGTPTTRRPLVTQSFQVNPAAQTITFGLLPSITVGAPVAPGARVVGAAGVVQLGRTVGVHSRRPPRHDRGGRPVHDHRLAGRERPLRGGPRREPVVPSQPGQPGVGRADDHVRAAARCEGRRAEVTLSAHASCGLPVSFSSGTPSVCTVKGSTVTTVAAGPCTITASQGGSARYKAAPDVSRSFQVNPVDPRSAGQTITFGPPPMRRSARRSPCRRTRRPGCRCRSAQDAPPRCARWRVPPSRPWRPAGARSRPRRAGAPATRRPPTCGSRSRSTRSRRKRPVYGSSCWRP